MTDHIVLQGLSARGFHGVLDVEKSDGQEFVVDVTMEVDLRRAGASDLLAHTVSYAEVAADVVALVTGPSLDLVETLADRIAAACLRRRLVQSVAVTVHKPQAPVGVPFGDVHVVVERHRSEPVVIALGANLGAVQATLEAAVRQLANLQGLEITAVSELFETDPVGGPEQPVYLNAVVLARTRLAAFALLTELHGIEADHGRARETRWGARTLDLDLVQYGDPSSDSDLVSNDPELMLPHPRAAERAFVLAPWSAVNPQAELRVGQASVRVSELLQRAEATHQAGSRDGDDVEAAMVTGARGVTIRLLLLLGVVVAALAYLGLGLWTGQGGALPPASWGALIVLAFMATGVFFAGLPVRRFLRGQAKKPLNPIRAMRTVVLAQASALTGALVTGWYVAQILLLLPDFDIASRRSLGWRMAALAAGGVLMAVSGMVVQAMCRVDGHHRDRDQPADDTHDRDTHGDGEEESERSPEH